MCIIKAPLLPVFLLALEQKLDAVELVHSKGSAEVVKPGRYAVCVKQDT